eukprot:6178081-Pleurochrysis_carterae.AAC.3
MDVLAAAWRRTCSSLHPSGTRPARRVEPTRPPTSALATWSTVPCLPPGPQVPPPIHRVEIQSSRGHQKPGTPQTKARRAATLIASG